MRDRCCPLSPHPATGSCHAAPPGLEPQLPPHPGGREQEPRTIEAYTDAVRLLATYCRAHGRPLLAGELHREHIQAFIADQLARRKPATAHNRYRGLHAFKWAVAEGDLETNPMDGMKPPQLPEQPVDAVRPEHLARLLRACEGRDFASRHDTAVILLLVDLGCAGPSAPA
jgi:integrase/recombinase XerC